MQDWYQLYGSVWICCNLSLLCPFLEGLKKYYVSVCYIMLYSDILLLLFYYYYYYAYYVSISTFYFFITQVFVNETTPRKYESSVLIKDEN